MEEIARRFRRTFEAIPDPAYLWERQSDWRIILTQANKAAYDLTEDEIALAEDECVDLSTLLPPKPELEKVEAMLQAALTGAAYEDGSSDSSSSSSDDNVAARVAAAVGTTDDDDYSVRATPTTTKVTPAADADDDYDIDEDEILAKIKSRRGAAVK